MSSHRADAPVAMISESVVTVPPPANVIVNGRCWRSTLVDVALHDLGAEALGLRAHLGHQVRTHDAVAEPRPVLDHRRQHQLSAGLEAFDEQRRQIRARRIERRGQPGRARPDDDHSPIRASAGSQMAFDQLGDVFLAARPTMVSASSPSLKSSSVGMPRTCIPLRDVGVLVDVQLARPSRGRRIRRPAHRRSAPAGGRGRTTPPRSPRARRPSSSPHRSCCR